MKKKILMLFALAMVMSIFTIPASAAEKANSEETEVIYVEGLGEVTVTTVTQVQEAGVRSSQRSASKAQEFKYMGQLIATVTLKATFGYDGSDAWVVSASGTKSISSGWSYSGQSIDKNGGSVSLTATLSNGISAKVPVEITMTCSPSGTIS